MNGEQLETIISAVVKDLFDADVAVGVTRPDEQFGDYATNVALQLAGRLGKQPREVAEQLAEALRDKLGEWVSDITIAGPGFINVTLADKAIVHVMLQDAGKPLAEQQILVEFGDPNPFKAMHLGHLYTTVAGGAIANLLERAGADVVRLGYHGDVGMHVARAMWALLRYKGDDLAEVLNSEQKIGEFYARGATAYKEDATAKAEIEELNKKVYELRLEGAVKDDTTGGRLAEIYKVGFERSFAAFDEVFAELGVDYKRHYLESEGTKTGLEYVRQNVGRVFEESEGAVIYRGEKAGLHTRVFINSRGLPTYEAKDLGLAELKDRDYPDAERSIIITAHEQSEYFKVMLAALAEIDAGLAGKTQHIGHGFLSLTSGKMSSRLGIDEQQVAANLLVAVRQAVSGQFPEASDAIKDAVYLAAVKYTFLRSRIGGDIVFDVKESVAIEGNSGPYIQYAHARARSILDKAGEPVDLVKVASLEPAERSLARKIGEYAGVLARATDELMPHHVCAYLYELAQVFNRFYEGNRVVGDAREGVRVALIARYADVLRDGLNVLGIEAPERL